MLKIGLITLLFVVILLNLVLFGRFIWNYFREYYLEKQPLTRLLNFLKKNAEKI